MRIYDLMPAMKSAFQTVALIGKYMNPQMRDQIVALAQFLTGRQLTVVIEERTAENSGIGEFLALPDLTPVRASQMTKLNLGCGSGPRVTVDGEVVAVSPETFEVLERCIQPQSPPLERLWLALRTSSIRPLAMA